jgi:hypothetical protein
MVKDQRMASGPDRDLEIEQHDAFQRREWRVERVGWVLLALLLLAGLSGLLGPGPLSWATAGTSSDPVRVEYQRVTHHEADDAVTLGFSPDAVEDGAVTVELTGSWVGAVDIQGISPEPGEQRATPGGVVLEIPVERSGDVEVTISFRPQEYGRLALMAAVGDSSVSLTQLVLP